MLDFVYHGLEDYMGSEEHPYQHGLDILSIIRGKVLFVRLSYKNVNYIFIHCNQYCKCNCPLE
jgi:hypothetical protein